MTFTSVIPSYVRRCFARVNPICGLLCGSVIALVLATPGAVASSTSGSSVSLLANGSFESGVTGWGGWQASWDNPAKGGGRSLFRHFADVMSLSGFQSFQSLDSPTAVRDARAMTRALARLMVRT